MAEYPYQGEKFEVDELENESGVCEIKVSDGTHTLSVTKNDGGGSVFKVSTVKGSWWWYHDTVKASVDRACSTLIESRKPVDPCKDMSEFVKSL